MQNPIDQPDYTSSSYQQMSVSWDFLSDVLAGQDTIKAAREKYLPKEPAELTEDYDRRLARSLYFEDYRDCVVNLGGTVFRKSPTLGEDVPPLIVEMTENIDNAGTHLRCISAASLRGWFLWSLVHCRRYACNL